MELCSIVLRSSIKLYGFKLWVINVWGIKQLEYFLSMIGSVNSKTSKLILNGLYLKGAKTQAIFTYLVMVAKKRFEDR